MTLSTAINRAAADDAGVFRMGLGLGARFGGGAAPAAPLALSIAPTVDYDAAFSTVATSGGRVTSVSDLQGLANMTGAAGVGPYAINDEAGDPCWSFEGAEYFDGSTAFVAGTRSVTKIMVCRVHKAKGISIWGLGNVAAATAVNTGGTVIRQLVDANSKGFLCGGGISGSTAATNKEYLQPHCGWQVIGVRSAPTAGGGQRLGINRKAANVVQNSINVASVAGFEMGRYPQAPGASGTWAQIDVKKAIAYNYALTDAEFNAIMAEVADYYDIPELTDDLMIEGDSIFDGVGTITSRNSLGMVATRPDNALSVPKTTRVRNNAVSGSTTVTATTRRDTATSAVDQQLPGTNSIVLQIGRNNLGALSQTGAQAYAEIVALINTTTTGYLQRGIDKVYVCVNIAVGSSLFTENEALRALLRSPTFLTDCLAGTGQAYEGKVEVVDLPLITTSGDTVFNSTADAGDTNWFQPDKTHTTAAGIVGIWTGLDTPQYGIASKF